MRLFIAFSFNSFILNEFKRIQEQLKTFPAELSVVHEPHLTLLFLGEVSETKIQQLVEQLGKIQHPAFTLTLKAIGVFPSKNYVRVVWVGITPEKPIIELQKKISTAVNYRDEHFSPHITLARVKLVKDKKAFQEQLKKIHVEPLSCEVTEFQLLQSILTPKGAVYKKIAGYSLSPS